MLWFKKRQPDTSASISERDQIVPAELPVPLDTALFEHYWAELKAVAEAEGGIEACLESLNAKQAQFVEALNPANFDRLGLGQVEMLLALVFTARRRIYPALESLGENRTAAAIRDLMLGTAPLAQRMQAFVDALPVPSGEGREAIKVAGKVRRAAWDFAAELLHFFDPVKYPLMTRWVWDQATTSGALREFIRGNETRTDIQLGGGPEQFEGARKWLAERIAEQGIYRDVHFWIDLVLAQAYADYFRSMAEGNLGGDFGRGSKPQEQLRKLLGIDAPRKDGRSRVKKQDSGPRIED